MFNPKDTLPDLPSELLAVALRDLEKVEESPNYKVEMANWHSVVLDKNFKEGKVCYVCLAGSVMANSLKFPFDEIVGADDLLDMKDGGVCWKLRWFDSLLAGKIDDAFWLNKNDLRRMSGIRPDFWEEVCNYNESGGVPYYYDDPSSFKEYLEETIKFLKKNNF